MFIRDILVNVNPQVAHTETILNEIIKDTADKLGITRDYYYEKGQDYRTDKFMELIKELDRDVAKRLEHWFNASNEKLAEADKLENSHTIKE